jgi:glutamate racemase
MARKNRACKPEQDTGEGDLKIDSVTTQPATLAINSKGPIGVFDSGIGGLSVLRHIRKVLPHEDLIYFADSDFMPIGSKPEHVIVTRSLAIAEFLLTRGAKTLVLACNTATAAAIKGLREIYPDLPLVGVEPGLKPAAALSHARIVGVLATERTLDSAKFDQLRAQISAASEVRFLSQACIGLADQVEKGELDSATTAAMIRRYVVPLLEQGADTLVLGCTHYPFVQALIEGCIRETTDRPITIIDTGEAVARQLDRLLAQHHLQRPREHSGMLEGFTTGSESALSGAFTTLLEIQARVTRISLEHRLA